MFQPIQQSEITRRQEKLPIKKPPSNNQKGLNSSVSLIYYGSITGLLLPLGFFLGSIGYAICLSLVIAKVIRPRSIRIILVCSILATGIGYRIHSKSPPYSALGGLIEAKRQYGAISL